MTDFEDFAPPAPEEGEDLGTMAGPADDLDYDALAEFDLEREMADARLEDLYKPAIDEEEWTSWPINALVKFDRMQAARIRARKKLPIEAVPTPFPFVNRRCMNAGGQRGYARGWHTIIGAASNRGKTTLAINYTARAIRYGWSVAYLALEADLADTASRIAAVVSGQQLKNITQGHGYSFTAEKAAHEAVLEQPGDLYLTRLPVREAEDIYELACAYRRHRNIRVLIVDHIQLARTGDERNRAAQAADVSSMLATIAREERIVTIGLSQLTTGAARNTKDPPSMFDLMGGVPITQDAELCIMVDHTEKSWKTNRTLHFTETDLAIAKNRQGPDGTFTARIEWSTGQIHEVEERGGEPVPSSEQLGL